MKFLLNTPKAKRQRKYVDNKRKKGICLCCPQLAEKNSRTCGCCKIRMRKNYKIWRTK